LVSHPIYWVLSQVLSKKQHSADLRVAFPTDMKFVRLDTGYIAFEEMMTRGQIATASIAKVSKRLGPIFNCASEFDHRKYVDFAFRGKVWYGSAPNVMDFHQGRPEDRP
jgi:hypothetical protein